jgi:hypothetical protein
LCYGGGADYFIIIFEPQLFPLLLLARGKNFLFLLSPILSQQLYYYYGDDSHYFYFSLYSQILQFLLGEKYFLFPSEPHHVLLYYFNYFYCGEPHFSAPLLSPQPL